MATKTWVALLRGINVGGNTMVPMAALKQTFERLGFDAVKTYINSGNVVFRSRDSAAVLVPRIEAAIAKDVGQPIRVTVRDLAAIERLLQSIPEQWVNDSEMRCEVMFLWPEVDRRSVLHELPADPAIEDLRHERGALVWRIDRGHVGRSRVPKMIGGPLYKQLTGRNVNTVRKLCALMRAAQS